MQVQRAVENAGLSDLDLYLLSDRAPSRRPSSFRTLPQNTGQKLAASRAEVMFYLYLCDFLKLRMPGIHACEGF